MSFAAIYDLLKPVFFCDSESDIKLTAVEFEPAHLQTAALTQRLGPLGHTVADV